MRWPNDTQAPGDPQFKHVSDDRGSKHCERVLWIYVDGKASWKSISVFEVGYCEKYSETSQIVLRSQRQHFIINLLIYPQYFFLLTCTGQWWRNKMAAIFLRTIF